MRRQQGILIQVWVKTLALFQLGHLILGHLFTYQATIQPNGAVSFYNSDFATASFNNFTMNLISTNSTDSLSVSVCTCAACGSCMLVVRPIAEFFPLQTNCTIPVSNWFYSKVVIPLVNIEADQVVISRFNIINSGADDIEVFIDNVAFV